MIGTLKRDPKLAGKAKDDLVLLRALWHLEDDDLYAVEPKARHHYDPGSKAHELLGTDELSRPVTTRRPNSDVLRGLSLGRRCTRS